MDTQRIVQDYIQNSRVLIKSYPYLAAKYHMPYDLIKKKKDVKFDYPELALCYSLKKACEQIKINDSTSYIIFDVAIERYLNSMDALLFVENVPKWSIELQIKKMYAEAFYSIGDFQRAYIAKLYVDEIERIGKEAGEETATEKDFLNPVRAVMVNFQDLFIILHELSHYRLAQLSAEEYNKIICEARSRLIENDATIKALNSSNLQDFVLSECKDIENDPYNYLYDNMKEDLGDPNFWQLFKAHLYDYYLKDKNIEEIICDEYAISSLRDIFLPMFSKLPIYKDNAFEKTKDLLYISCYTALGSVNYLRRIENDALRRSKRNTVNENGHDLFSTIPDVQRRKRCLINYIIKCESELAPDKETSVGLYWTNLARSIDRAYIVFEEVFQGKYSCCDISKMISKIKSSDNNEAIIEDVISSLEEILNW